MKYVIAILVLISGALGWQWHLAEQEIQDLYKARSVAHVAYTEAINAAKVEVQKARRQRTIDLNAKHEAHRRELSNVKADKCFTKPDVVPIEHIRLLNGGSMRGAGG